MRFEITPQKANVEARYVGDEGVVSRYRFTVEGIDVLDVVIFNDQEQRYIYVGPVGAHSTLFVRTHGHAQTKLREVASTDGSEVPDGFNVGVSATSVYEYVVPRLLRFITQVNAQFQV